MSMVEGIGDEVVQVFGICLVILIFVTAWKSTAIRELPQIRAVFIVDRRSQVLSDANRTEAASVPPDPGPVGGAGPGPAAEERPADAATEPREKPAAQPSSEINAFRLSYFSNLQSQPSTSAGPPAEAPPDPPDDPEHSIRVKLKYLNDDQRIVRGNLKEHLGQFKRRYFQIELSNNKNVLLIFQGRVLREDETLETIGMYDNCVVHCLVKAGRAPETEARASQGATSVPADWNLGPVLVATLVAMFALAWFSYWTYPQLFGMTSKILLACLTTIFLLAVASFYYPQLFQSL